MIPGLEPRIAPAPPGGRARVRGQQLPGAARWWTRVGVAGWTAVALLASAAGFAAWSGRHLWADGAYFFVEMVAKGGFSVYDLPREHARYLTQGPAVLLLAAGVRSGEAVSLAFGLGHLLPPVAALLYLLALVPPDGHLVRTAGFIAAGLSVAVSIFAVSEALVLAAAALPVLAIAYLRPRDAGHLAVAAVLDGIAARSYQLYPLLALFVLHAAWRAFRRGGVARPARLAWAALVAVSLAGLALAVYSMADVRGTANTAFAVRTLFLGLRHPPLAFLALAALVVGALELVPRARGVFNGLLALGSAVLAAMPWLLPESNDPFLAYLGRGFATALGIALVGGACVLGARARPATAGLPAWARAGIGPALLVCVLSWDLDSTVEWRGFREVVRNELRRLDGCGVVPVMETEAWKDRVGVQMLRRYTWFWSSPYLVGAVAPPGPISVVLSNPSTSADPLFRGAPPDLSRIGKSWDFQGRTCASVPGTDRITAP